MKIKIRWRCDCEEAYVTDNVTIEVDTWDEVLREIESIEGSSNTVLTLERMIE